MKAKNPGMHYEYIPKPNEWRNDKEIFYNKSTQTNIRNNNIIGVYKLFN
jgi:hypothetical protein